MIVVLLTLLLGAPAAAQTSPAPLLRHKFMAGEKRRYVKTQKRVMKTTLDGREVRQTMTRTTDLTLVVEKVDADGVAQIRHVLSRIRYTRTGPGENTNYDSAAKTNAAGTENLGLLVGTEYALTLTPRGEVRDAKPLPQTRTKLETAGAAGALPAVTSGLRYLVPTLALPAHTLKPGDTWSEALRFEAPGVGTITGTYVFTFRGPKADTANTATRIDVATENVSVAPQAGTLVAITVDKYDETGEIDWDEARGRLIRRASTTTMTMRVTMNDKKATQTSESTDTIRLVTN